MGEGERERGREVGEREIDARKSRGKSGREGDRERNEVRGREIKYVGERGRKWKGGRV